MKGINLYRALVLFLVAAVLWVFGTLPWVVIKPMLCDRGFSAACPDADAIDTVIRQILAFNLIVIILAGFAIARLRQHPYWQSAASSNRRRRRSRRSGR
ncbi:MAG: hypothetical protein WBA10_10535 [Elainellaceae cyanobacterium]